MTLTDEQREPLSHARSPQQAAGHRRIVVATVAGPGSGKTTMQEGLAAELCAKDHERVCKLFFNRKAADDGLARLQAALPREHRNRVECTTTHSAALRYASPAMGDNPPGRCVDDAALQEFICDRFADKIRAWHGAQPYQAPPDKRAEAEEAAANMSNLVAFWIF